MGVVVGVIAIGTVAGTVPPPWCTVAARITETPPGAAQPHLPMVRMAPHTTALATIRPPGPTHVEALFPTATAVPVPARPTTPTPGRLHGALPPQMPMAPPPPRKGTTREPAPPHPPCRIPTPTVAREPRRSQGMATLHTRSTQPTRTEPPVR